jgi:hypothetical protein
MLPFERALLCDITARRRMGWAAQVLTAKVRITYPLQACPSGMLAANAHHWNTTINRFHTKASRVYQLSTKSLANAPSFSLSCLFKVGISPCRWRHACLHC